MPRSILHKCRLLKPLVSAKQQFLILFLLTQNGGIPAIIKINRNPRSNARRKMDGRMEAELLRITCSPAPDGRVRWTLRLLEKQIRLEFDELSAVNPFGLP